MHDTLSLINQQVGFRKWTNSDSILKRLECRKDEQFWHLISSSEMNYYDPPVFACKFAPKNGYEHIVAIANEDGQIAIHDTTHTKSHRYGVHAHNNAIFDLTWMFSQMKLVSASGDHTAALFNIREGSIALEDVFHGHTQSIKAVTSQPNCNSIFATGSRDGKIMIWDTRCHDQHLRIFPDSTLNDTHALYCGKKSRRDSCSNSVTSLVYQDEYNLISCGAGDGFINIWDTRKTYSQYKRHPTPKFQLPYPGDKLRNGYSNLILSSDTLKLYASCLDNVIYCFNVGTFNTEPIMKYYGHKNSSFYVKSSLSKDGRYLISGSSDMFAYIWDTSHSQPLIQLCGHEAEVTCVAWRQKGEPVIITCSDDLRHNIWRIGTEEVHEDVVGHVKVYDNSLKRSIATDLSFTKRIKLNPEPLKAIQNIREIPHWEIPRKRIKLNEEEDLVITFPNFNLDGTTPHLSTSPLKKPDVDWLTQLRKGKRTLTNDLEEISSPSSPKNRKSVSSSPSRRRTPKRKKEQSPLLKFFKVRNPSSPSCSKTVSNSIVSHVQI